MKTFIHVTNNLLQSIAHLTRRVFNGNEEVYFSQIEDYEKFLQ